MSDAAYTPPPCEFLEIVTPWDCYNHIQGSTFASIVDLRSQDEFAENHLFGAFQVNLNPTGNEDISSEKRWTNRGGGKCIIYGPRESFEVLKEVLIREHKEQPIFQCCYITDWKNLFKAYPCLFTSDPDTPRLILPSMILKEGLFLSSYTVAEDIKVIKTLNIKNIINVTRREPKFTDRDKFNGSMELPTYLNIEADDVWDEDLYQHFEKTCEFIHAALSRKENVLVHCMAGVSRSASVVIAYLIKHTGRRFSEALEYTRSNRRIVCPNAGFSEQLQKWDKELHGSETKGCCIIS